MERLGVEIDYASRSMFLPATTIAAECGWGSDVAPIRSLEAISPTFADWLSHAPSSASAAILLPLKVRTPGGLIVAEGLDRLAMLKGATALKTALQGWMERHHFSDAWIAENALASLSFARSQEQPLRWIQLGWPVELPAFKMPGVDLYRNETDEAYLTRLDRAHRDHRKKVATSLRDQRATNYSRQKLSACFTAIRFTGATYAEIAGAHSPETNGDPDNVRKAVDTFCARTGLHVPARTSAKHN
jgi:hypothetical protein